MSFNRDLEIDRATTRAVLAGQRPARDGRLYRGREVNWLDHQVPSGAAQIDEMLISGATKAQMKKARDTVDKHLDHLCDDHGLPIIEVDGLFRFDRAALELAAKSAGTCSAAIFGQHSHPLELVQLLFREFAGLM